MGCHGMMMAICLLDARDLIHSVAVPGPWHLESFLALLSNFFFWGGGCFEPFLTCQLFTIFWVQSMELERSFVCAPWELLCGWEWILNRVWPFPAKSKCYKLALVTYPNIINYIYIYFRYIMCIYIYKCYIMYHDIRTISEPMQLDPTWPSVWCHFAELARLFHGAFTQPDATHLFGPGGLRGSKPVRKE